MLYMLCQYKTVESCDPDSPLLECVYNTLTLLAHENGYFWNSSIPLEHDHLLYDSGTKERVSLLLDSPVRNMLLDSSLLLCYTSALFLAGALSLDNADMHLSLER
jgi:hypothetical protein